MHVLIAALHRPIHPTGVCRHAVNLALCLAEQPEITKISLVIGTWQKRYFETSFSLTSKKIKLISVNLKNTSINRNKWFLWGLPQLADDLSPDIIHFSFPFPFFKTKFKVAVVTTVHDLYPYEFPENFGFPQAWFNRLFLKQCINQSDALACVSKVTADKLNFYFPNLNFRQKIAVIYNYVNFEDLPPKAPQQLSEPNSFLLSVAQHRQNKNLDLLIKSYAWLLNNRKLDLDTQLIIVGTSGPETENIQNLILSLSLESKVILLSAIEDQELCWLYQNCQVFVVPSSTEGFCLPLAEALCLSDRIVCSNIPIFREVGTSNCTYFSLQVDAVVSLSQAIINSGNKRNLAKFSKIYRFDKCTIAKQYINLYSQLSNGHFAGRLTN